ncbi:L-seryl-tRNA(Sec) selenium transferase [Paenibacillus cellulositrophicus]|uniref:L-seryl-tRNA(Sec) selenium transferase n=1 Tax=Paenibacillus cellulositrophicus TaxID=562959 RepID=UPI00203AA851|nr:L-seryl-tRNA(Sec) selenium transferase [Paenibacillus cellulositrophicus]MCM2996924.1 L-seryl-tRNA(Sec) selenium transferase [Paenibacillus cellulositrophicus]
MEYTTEKNKILLRAIPAIHYLIEQPRIKKLMEKFDISPNIIMIITKELVNDWRQQVLNQLLQFEDETDFIEKLNLALEKQISLLLSQRLHRVINGTGVVLHTNLGRALMSKHVAAQMVETATCYSNLEYDIEKGERSSRYTHLEDLLCLLTGSEGAMVVNNNAAAVYLILNELAKNREVIISRGQLVEIGGSFRVSEIMKESGARLVEVGTSNKTYSFDYEQAINTETAMLMKVHSSNFRTLGFTCSVSSKELVQLGKRYKIPVYEDLGSGTLFDLKKYGIGDEPLVRDVIRIGTDLVSFSGDKLLGGPQAGIIVGKKSLIEKLKKNQLARILRVDKITIAGLEATLKLYLFPEKARKEIPVIRDILVPVDEIEQKARLFMEKIGIHSNIKLSLLDEESTVGGGTLPTITLPTKVIAIQFTNQTAQQAKDKLRTGTPSIIVRVVKDQIIIDFRTIMKEEIDLIIEAVKKII